MSQLNTIIKIIVIIGGCCVFSLTTFATKNELDKGLINIDKRLERIENILVTGGLKK